MKLSLSPGARGDSAVGLPWFWVGLDVSTHRGPVDSGSHSCNQADAALHEGQHPAKLALSIPPSVSSSPPNKLQPRHASSLHKSMILSCHLYRLPGNFQQCMEQGQPWHIPRPGDGYGERRQSIPDSPLLPAHPWQQAWMEARRSLQPGGTFNARGGHQENDSCLP